MLVLDTDHISEYQKGTSPAARRLNQSGEPYAATIITVEEVMRGWMAAIRRSPDPFKQINSYGRLRQLFRFFGTWQVLDWSPASAAEFVSIKSSKSRAGTMDLKIACITIANNATLLSRNLNDFRDIPGLRVADWLSE